MGGLASTALYLTSSLVAAGQAPEPAPSVQSALPVAAGAAGTESRAPAPTVFTLPAAARSAAARSLDAAIADEVRRDAAPRADVDPATGAMLAGAGEDDGSDAGALGLAVVAAHDARIAFLRQRIAQAAAAGDHAGAGLAGLRLRLERAEAARRLALARTEPGAAPDCLAGGADGCRVAAVSAQADAPVPILRDRQAAPAQKHAPRPLRLPAAVAAAPRRAPLPVTAAGHAPAPGRAGPHHLAAGVALAAARPAPAGGRVGVTARAVVRPITPEGAGDRVAHASAHARHLLAAARRLLEAGASSNPPRSIELAGLWRWDGSENWSLSTVGRRSA